MNNIKKIMSVFIASILTTTAFPLNVWASDNQKENVLTYSTISRTIETETSSTVSEYFVEEVPEEFDWTPYTPEELPVGEIYEVSDGPLSIKSTK